MPVSFTLRFYAELNDFLEPGRRQVAFERVSAGRKPVGEVIAALVRISLDERRILLTRDRELLRRRALTHGYEVRETAPRRQLVEVLDRFDLRRAAASFTRCLRCNERLRAVPKEAIAEELPRQEPTP